MTPIQLAWDVPGNTAGITNYKVKYSQDSNNLTQEALSGGNPPTPFLTLNLTAGTWFAQVVSVDINGAESDPSNLIQIDVPGLGVPTNLRIN